MTDPMKNQEIPPRAQMATRYFEADYNLNNQEQWYSAKAGTNKSWHHWLGLMVLAGGAGTSLIQVWAPSPPDTPVHWVTIVTALLGAVVVLAKGIERIWVFDDTWASYRQASEMMKREQRLFINGAGPYSQLPEDEAAYVLFVDRVEDIIAAEQENFWAARAGDKGEPAPGEPTSE